MSEKIADNAMMLLAPDRPVRRVTFKAAKGGDSVAAVARRYGVSADQVAQWNAVAIGARVPAGPDDPGDAVGAGQGRRKTAAAPAHARAAPSTRATASKPNAKPSAKVAVTKPAAKL